MTAPDLLPCPFCGGPAMIFREDEACCQDEACAGWTNICCSIAAWNRRDPAVILAAALELPEVKALVEAAVDGKQALMDAADEIAELRLSLSRLDLELPWISDAIDKLTLALAALKPDVKGGA